MATTTQHISIDNTMGAAFIGVVAAAVLHGVSCVQGWYYFTHQHDRWAIKTVVACVLVSDFIHQALISHAVYTYVVSNYDNPSELDDLVWSVLVEVIFNGLTALLVQCFLALRVWRLSNGNIWLTTAVLSLVFAEFACVVAYAAESLRLHTFPQLVALKPLSIAVNALAAVGDVLIASALCWMLHRSRTGFQRSDTIINKLILFAVNTGLLTSICAVASLISIIVAPNTFLYIGFYFCIGRLYCNSLLATLNARKAIRGAADGVHTSSGGNLSLSMKEMPTAKTTISGTCQRPGNISIKIDTTKEFTSDRTSDRSSKVPSLQYQETP